MNHKSVNIPKNGSHYDNLTIFRIDLKIWLKFIFLYVILTLFLEFHYEFDPVLNLNFFTSIDKSQSIFNNN